MIKMTKLHPTVTQIEVYNEPTENSAVLIFVESTPNGASTRISFSASKDILPDYIDEIVTALYDARRIAKGTLTVL
jgi:hypothetical protein